MCSIGRRHMQNVKGLFALKCKHLKSATKRTTHTLIASAVAVGVLKWILSSRLRSSWAKWPSGCCQLSEQMPKGCQQQEFVCQYANEDSTPSPMMMTQFSCPVKSTETINCVVVLKPLHVQLIAID